MTTTYPAVTLDAVGAALVHAHDALSGPMQENTVEDALVQLCRASYDALVSWEVGMSQLVREPRPETESWRTPLDELRVQAALAEMDLRDHGSAPVVEAFVTSVSSLVATARHDVGKALAALRSELKKLPEPRKAHDRDSDS